jgi:glutamate-1-semialdehyde 2,1-aminomutase
VAQHTVVLEYNNIPQLEEAFAIHGPELACLMIEPIAGNMNFVRASAPFAKRCRELCTQYGALLIFDEVMTGFRVALGGAQSVMGMSGTNGESAPDITVLGKVIGGGMPLAAFGGSKDIMSQLAPLGPVYQAGTLSGNPVATACGLATLKEISKPGFYDELSVKTQHLTQGLKAAAHQAGIDLAVDSEGGMFGFFLMDDLPQNYAKVMTTDSPRFNQFFHGMLDKGHYFAPALYEAGFVSSAHNLGDIDQTIDAACAVLKQLQ